jgi:hypothetical protein
MIHTLAVATPNNDNDFTNVMRFVGQALNTPTLRSMLKEGNTSKEGLFPIVVKLIETGVAIHYINVEYYTSYLLGGFTKDSIHMGKEVQPFIARGVACLFVFYNSSTNEYNYETFN